jgi:hypothetical protein
MKSMGIRAGLFTMGVGALVAGCGGEDDAGGEAIGTAMLEISTVPTGAQCLVVGGTGVATFTVTAALTPGATSANISLGRLPLGASTINANVYDAACGSISGVLPSWVAEPQTVTFRAGVVTSLVLNLRPNNVVSATANFVGNVVAMSAGYSSSGLVLADGSVRTAGNWSPFAGPTIYTNEPALTGIKELAPKKLFGHACARNATQVLCWGAQNPNGQLGPGVPVGTGSSTPVVVTGVTSAQKLAVGLAHTCALRTGGNVVCWGLNSSGELGNGTTTSSAAPVSVSGLAGASDALVAGYSYTCANTYTGVSCWGSNAFGQLGDGTSTNRSVPTSVSGLVGTVSLSAGAAHACAVRADGSARCWGSNAHGELGDGTTTLRMLPAVVLGLTDAVEVAAGGDHTCFRRANGTVACVGGNAYGQLGDGTATDRSTVANVPGVTGAVALVSGYHHNCALLDNRTITCWGWDADGQCGDGVVGNNFKPAAAIIQ